MMTPIVPRLALLLAASALSGAAELVVRDLQADLLLPPTHYDFALTTPGGSQSGHDGFSSGTALTLGGRYSLARPGDAVGIVGGADLELAGYSSTSSQMGDVGGRLDLGLGYAVTDSWVVIATGGYAYGLSRFTAKASNGAPSVTEHGSYRGPDVRLEVHYHLTRSVAVAALGGYWWDSHHLSGDGTRLQLDRAGFYVGVGLIWRFTSAPEHLE